MTFTLVHSRADLPPSWDGEPVTWNGWTRNSVGSLVHHCDPTELACRACGSIETTTLTNHGSINGWGRLVVDRCPGCGHDTVTDQATGKLWDLDLSDYGPDGSRVEGTLW